MVELLALELLASRGVGQAVHRPGSCGVFPAEVVVVVVRLLL